MFVIGDFGPHSPQSTSWGKKFKVIDLIEHSHSQLLPLITSRANVEMILHVECPFHNTLDCVNPLLLCSVIFQSRVRTKVGNLP